VSEARYERTQITYSVTYNVGGATFAEITSRAELDALVRGQGLMVEGGVTRRPPEIDLKAELEAMGHRWAGGALCVIIIDGDDDDDDDDDVVVALLTIYAIIQGVMMLYATTQSYAAAQ
jgi:hypothetical protein